jgi:hypothetical protein
MLKSMMRKFFAYEACNELTAGRFNHCSSVCPHKSGVLIAWYAGLNECDDTQGVHVAYVEDGIQSAPVRVGDKTGNPVLLPYGKDAILLWSRFEDTGYLRSRVDRWKYCSNWLQWVRFENGVVKIVGEPKEFSNPDEHLLGRCNPLIMPSGEYILPMYDEVARQGVIYRGDGWDFECVGRIGENMIQPTLWLHSGSGDKDKKRIHSLSRNFGSRFQFYSQHSYSDDMGETWSKPKSTGILNHNSSLHSLYWNNHQLLLWNNTQKRNRVDMTLGVIDHFNGIKARPGVIVEGYGAYPSMCVDNNGYLNMSYTSADHIIIHRVWNKKHFWNKLGRE